MLGALMQEWITVQGAAGKNLVQLPHNYVDVTYLQDLCFWIDVATAQSSSTVLLSFQTAPFNEDALFQNLVASTDLKVIAGTVTPVAALAQDCVVPPARWVRWSLTSSAAWSATFRVFMAANDVRP